MKDRGFNSTVFFFEYRAIITFIQYRYITILSNFNKIKNEKSCSNGYYSLDSSKILLQPNLLKPNVTWEQLNMNFILMN